MNFPKFRTSSPPPLVGRLDALTGLRWWAAFAVFAFHARNFAPLPGYGLMTYGHYGVSFFFVLSGFVLTWSAKPTVTVRQFWFRRFARIWPAAMVALLIAIPIFHPWWHTSQSPWEKPFSLPVIALSILFLQGYSTRPEILFSGNPAAWTLSCEFLFYFMHPLVNGLTSRWGKRGNLALFWATVLVATIINFLGLNSLPLPFLRLWEFFLGMAVANALRWGWRPRIPVSGTYILIVGLMLIPWSPIARHLPSSLINLIFLFQPVLFGVFFALMIAATAYRQMLKKPTIMDRWILVKGGEWSYCFYLVHASVIYVLRDLFGQQPAGHIGTNLCWWLLIFILGLAVTALLHLLVEKPAEKYLRAWGDNKFGVKNRDH